MFGQSVFWRETMKPSKFLIFDGRVVLILLPTIMHLRLWTILLAIFTMMAFWYFDRKGVPAGSIMRFLRSKVIGPKRSARGLHEERQAVDFGFECQPYMLSRMAEEAGSNAGPKPTFIQKLLRVKTAGAPQGTETEDG